MPAKETSPLQVFFETTDHIKIAANFFPSDSKHVVILLHQFNRDKSIFDSFAGFLSKNGFGVLAIDFRGHGESKSTGSLSDPSRLTPKDFLDMEKDIAAAVSFVKSKGFSALFLIGGSIGANWALMYPGRHQGFVASVALSPGLDFKGLQPKTDAQKIKTPVLLVVSEEDAYSFSSAKELFNFVTSPKEFFLLSDAGHAGFMLENNASLKKRILNWLKKFG